MGVEVSSPSELSQYSIPKGATHLKCTHNRILIVDDNSFNIVSLSMILSTNFGVDVDKAFNGQDALEKVLQKNKNLCCKTNYKLILMDCNMPIMDGFQCTAEIRRMEDAYELKGITPIHIVACTAADGADQIAKSKEHGMEGYLSKPISVDALWNLLKKHQLLHDF